MARVQGAITLDCRCSGTAVRRRIFTVKAAARATTDPTMMSSRRGHPMGRTSFCDLLP